jgi:hypothetical protein
MKSTTSRVPLTKLKPNQDNPRVLKDDKFQKLVASLETFPDMLELRPIVVDENWTVLGGNMRLRALQHLKVKEVPVTQVDGLTPEQKREFIIKDNASFGEWDWDILANEWDPEQLTAWGLDVWLPEPEPEDLVAEEKNKPATMKITFASPEQLQEAEIDIQEILDRKYPGSFFSISAGEI